MANWDYKEKYIYDGHYGPEEYEIHIAWNTTSDSGALFLHPNHSDIEKRTEAFRFGPEQIPVLIKMLEKIKEDQGY